MNVSRQVFLRAYSGQLVSNDVGVPFPTELGSSVSTQMA